jgi:hypothetical protein
LKRRKEKGKAKKLFFLPCPEQDNAEETRHDLENELEIAVHSIVCRLANYVANESCHPPLPSKSNCLPMHPA